VRNRRGEELWFADCAVMTWNEMTGSYWVLGFLQNITDRVRVEADLITSQRRLSLVNRIARSIHGDLSLTELLGHILTEVHKFLPAYRVSYSKLSHDGRMEVMCSRQPSMIPSIEGNILDVADAMPEMERLFELSPTV